jgi:hypothetical protein
MKTFTFRISQDLEAYYNARVDVKASSEQAALNKLKKMSTKELDKVAYDWEQMTDNASAVGEITIQECLEDSKDEE